MRLLLDGSGLDRIIARRRDWCLGGAFLMSLALLAPSGWCFGLTGFSVLSLGIYACALRR